MNVSIDQLADAVMQELKNYDLQSTAKAKEAVRKVTKQCRDDIAANAPGQGHYAKSWRTKEEYNSATELRMRVYSTKYQLTHLLEHGHEKWVWGYYTGEKVDPKPHIRPAEARAEDALMKELKKL